jgi:hypothetical protein
VHTTEIHTCRQNNRACRREVGNGAVAGYEPTDIAQS